MRDSRELQTTLSRAEAALARAEAKSATVGASRTGPDLKLDYIRVYLRRLLAALSEPDGSSPTGSIDTAHANCREMRTGLLALNPSATIPFHCLEPSCPILRSPRSTCWLGHLDEVIAARSLPETASGSSAEMPRPAPRHAIHRPETPIPARAHGLNRAMASSPLVRQSIGLLALVLAYLAYFHIDVQLQIVMLPSTFP